MELRRDLRCRGKRHAILIDSFTLEIKCDSRLCGAGPGVVVLHRWDLTGEKEMTTNRYRDPVATRLKR